MKLIGKGKTYCKGLGNLFSFQAFLKHVTFE